MTMCSIKSKQSKTSAGMFCRPLEPTEALHILQTLSGHKLAVNLRNCKCQLFLYLEELKGAVDSVMQIYCVHFVLASV